MANQYRSVLSSSGPAPTGGDALPAEVLSGKTFTNDNGAQTGTMTNNGAVTQTITAGQTYTIPAGYHNGSGTVSDTSSLQFISSNYAGSNGTMTFTAEVGDIFTIASTRETAGDINMVSVSSNLTLTKVTSPSEVNGYVAYAVCTSAGTATVSTGANCRMTVCQVGTR